MSRTGVSHRAPLLDAGSTRYLATTGSSSGSWRVSRWSGLYRWLAPPACPGECVRLQWVVLRRLGWLGSASSSGSTIAYIIRLVNRSRKKLFPPREMVHAPITSAFPRSRTARAEEFFRDSLPRSGGAGDQALLEGGGSR